MYPKQEFAFIYPYVNCGFKSEYYVATTLYDLWDGQINIPNINNYPTYPYLKTKDSEVVYHLWNDYTNRTDKFYLWDSEENIEIDFYEICRPLIENTGDNKLENIDEYFNELINNVGTNYQLKSDISRVFRENRVLKNIDEYQWGGNVHCISSDNLHTIYQLTELNWPCLLISENFNVDCLNNFNNNPNNSYSILAYPNKTNVITDPIWLGSGSAGWHTELSLNDYSDGNNLQHGILSTANNLLIDVIDGQIHIGGQNASSDLSITDGSLLRVRNWSEGLIINNNSTLYIESGGSLIIEQYADVLLKGNGKIIIEPGAYLCISPDANITFETSYGYISIDENSIIDKDPDWENILQGLPESCGIPCGNIVNINNNGFSYVTFNGDYEFWPESQPISGNLSFADNLIIHPNAILTVDNSSVFEFNIGSKVIVEPGGKLIINGATFTNICGNSWQGIVVLGNRNLPQTEQNQGVLEIKNGAIIENAETGVYVGNPDSYASNVGGILKVENASFRNCITGIYFQPYRISENSSYIKNSTFETTEDLYQNGVNPNAFIYLHDVGTIDIKGNHFINEHLYNPYGNETLQGKGIVSMDADFLLKPFCTNSEIYPCPENELVKNRFENLYVAVDVHKSAKNPYCLIDDNEFYYNWVSVALNGVDNSTITSNDIDVYAAVNVSGQSGIYLVNSNGFHIEDNDIYSTSGNLPTGIYIQDCRAVNEIYRNRFEHLYRGIEAFGNNSAPLSIPPNISGLNIICNSFLNVNYDIYVAPSSLISTTQGSEGVSAGNTFLPECSGSYNELYNWGSFQINYFKETSSEYIPSCNYHVNLLNAKHNTCPSKLGGGMPIEKIAMLNDSINLVDAELNTLIDGGNTETVNEIIAETEPEEALKLRNELLGGSPNLSDTVMIHTTVIEDVLPSYMVKQILSSNPSAAKSDLVQQALDNRINQLPFYMREEINLGRDTFSYTEGLKSRVSHYTNEREDGINKRMLMLMQDSLPQSLDSLETMLTGENNLYRTYQLVDFYVKTGRFNEAQNLFSQIPQNYELNSGEQNNYELLTQFFNIQMNLKTNHLNWFDMSGEQKQIITTLSTDSTTQAGMRSRAVLSLIDNKDYGYPIPEIEEGGNKNMNPEPVVYPETFAVFPEPAVDYFIVEYALNEKEELNDIRISLHDESGAKLNDFDLKTRANQLLYECGHLKPGNYYCRKYNKSDLNDEIKISISGNSSASEFDKTGIEQTAENGAMLKVFPNPAKAYVMVSVSLPENYTGNARIEIINATGIPVASRSVPKQSDLLQFSTKSLPAGIYMVNLLSGDTVAGSVRVVIQKN